MEPSADLSTILNRILDTAADNLRVAKILIQLGLDPNNITFDALFNRLIEIVLANITLANMFGLLGAIFFVATLLRKRTSESRTVMSALGQIRTHAPAATPFLFDRPELSTRLKDHVERRLGCAAKACETRLGRDVAQSTLAGLGA